MPHYALGLHVPVASYILEGYGNYPWTVPDVLYGSVVPDDCILSELPVSGTKALCLRQTPIRPSDQLGTGHFVRCHAALLEGIY